MLINYALARKYRPNAFDEIVGQESVLQALKNSFDSQRLHHAYLLTGIRGVGKTTIGRLIAKCLNCVNGISSKPCNKCNNCLNIDKGSFLDLIEVDAASKTKIDDTRDLLDTVHYQPNIGRFKVYLIDEVHMLSAHSFNALLKTLEEPPSFVKFILATTDKHKLPITILSRCLQFYLKPLSINLITKRLGHVLTCESISFDTSALALISKASDGSMRDALSIADQAIAFGSGKVEIKNVSQMLGLVDASYVELIFSNIVNLKVNDLFILIDEMFDLNINFKFLAEDLLTLVHKIALQNMNIKVHDTSLIIKELAMKLNATQIQFYYSLINIGIKDFELNNNYKQSFEMLVLRLVSLMPMNMNDYKLSIPTFTSNSESFGDDLEHTISNKENLILSDNLHSNDQNKDKKISSNLSFQGEIKNNISESFLDNDIEGRDYSEFDLIDNAQINCNKEEDILVDLNENVEVEFSDFVVDSHKIENINMLCANDDANGFLDNPPNLNLSDNTSQNHCLDKNQDYMQEESILQDHYQNNINKDVDKKREDVLINNNELFIFWEKFYSTLEQQGGLINELALNLSIISQIGDDIFFQLEKDKRETLSSEHNILQLEKKLSEYVNDIIRINIEYVDNIKFMNLYLYFQNQLAKQKNNLKQQVFNHDVFKILKKHLSVKLVNVKPTDKFQ